MNVCQDCAFFIAPGTLGPGQVSALCAGAPEFESAMPVARSSSIPTGYEKCSDQRSYGTLTAMFLDRCGKAGRHFVDAAEQPQVVRTVTMAVSWVKPKDGAIYLEEAEHLL